jgi:hypothetical protein
MIRVYFENSDGGASSYAELVAIFQDEELYSVCLEALEKEAIKRGFDIVTEGIDEELDINELG